jgi:hypothetical protein
MASRKASPVWTPNADLDFVIYVSGCTRLGAEQRSGCNAVSSPGRSVNAVTCNDLLEDDENGPPVSASEFVDGGDKSCANPMRS